MKMLKNKDISETAGFIALFGLSVLFVFFLVSKANAATQPFVEKHASSFEDAIPLVLKHEGRLNRVKGDRGGLTNYGVSYRYLQKLVSENPGILDLIDENKNGILDEYDLVHLSQAEATEIYLKEFWNRYEIGRIAHQPLATKVFDLTVNMGHEQCAKLLIRAIEKICPNIKVKNYKSMIKSDINDLDEESLHALMIAFCWEAESFYQELTKVHPVYQKFIKGWTRRVWDGVPK